MRRVPGTFGTTVSLTGGLDTGVSSGSCFKYRYRISDNVGNQATFTSTRVAKVDTSGPRVTAIASQQSGGTSGNGRLEVGDKMILTFSQSLATATVPTSFTGATESRTTGNVQLTIPGITDGALSTGTTSYLGGTDTRSASFNGAVALVNSGTSTTVTISVSAVSGDATAVGIGTLVFRPARTITSGSGNAAAEAFPTGSTFRLF